jgi:hypothetical protein
MVIAMYYNDHAPPHFHVCYRKQRAVIGISPRSSLWGKLMLKDIVAATPLGDYRLEPIKESS